MPSSPFGRTVHRTLYNNSRIFKAFEESLAESVAQGSVVKGIRYSTSVTNPAVVLGEGMIYVVTTGAGVIIGYYYVEE